MVYIDDIVIYAKNINEHDTILTQVLLRLREYEVKINFEKSKFGTTKLEILGNILENGELRINTKNFKEIIETNKEYKTKKDIQKLVGVITWYRNFIPDVSRMISCITELLRNKHTINWGEPQKKALEEIKRRINDNVHLKLPDFTKIFYIQCDASLEGMGAVLYQDHGVLSYYSKKFSGAERNYTIVEKEMYAMVSALEFYRNLIQGFTIVIETDSKNCCYENRVIIKRTERWKLIMNEFDLIIKNINGNTNNIADKLSRSYKINRNCEMNFIKECAYIGKFKDLERTKDERIIIKPENAKHFIKIMHEHAIHVGMSTLYKNLKRYYKIKNMKKLIREITKECERCLRCKNNTKGVKEKHKISSEKYFLFFVRTYLDHLTCIHIFIRK